MKIGKSLKVALGVVVIVALLAMAPSFLPLQSGVTIIGPLPPGTNNIGFVSAATSDPCQSSAVTKQKAFAHITTATTTALVPVSGTTQVFVCGFVATMIGTIAADTIQLEQGTGVACAGTPAAISPAFNSGILTAGATVVAYGNGGATVTSTTATTGLCAVSTVGTSPSIDLLVSYVQQ